VEFTKTPGWLDWYQGPSKPAFEVLPGSVDAHCHVFGPGAQFPYAPERKYTPCDASKDQLFALRDHLGFARNVVVQATCHGADNRAMVDAVKSSRGRARGVSTVRRDVTDAQLREMHDAGVRGVRFNFVKRLVDFTPKDELAEIASRITSLGWHVVVYFEAQDLPELWDFFTALPTTVVVDHMGRPDVRKPVDGPEFELFVKLMREHRNVWCKVSCPERLSVSGPPALNGERAYLDEWPMSEEQKQAVLARDLNRCIELGGNIYFLAKIGATDGKSFQQMAGSMTGLSEEEYREMMVKGGRSVEGNRRLGEHGDAQPSDRRG
jgi:2-pyrone-4,6-dicarboxylate lactonase